MALSLQVCLLAACNKEFSDPTGVQDDNYLEISFSRTTRADLDANGAGNFSEGDRIGLYIDNGSETAYRELAYTSGEWQPRLRRSDFGEGELTLAAHYPARSAAADDPAHAAFTLSEDQRAEGFAASDLLFARQRIPAGSYRAAMTFTHALHRLHIEINGEGISTPGLRSRMGGTVDLLTGTASVTEGSFGWITPRKNADGSYEAVIFPQDADPYRDGEGLLKIPTPEGEKTYRLPETLDGKPLERFEAGKQLTLTLTLKQGNPDLANKTLWVYGLDIPEFPGEEKLPTYKLYDKVPAGIWFRRDRDYEEVQNLTWKEGCGWYDCNKSPRYTEDDANTCWAASASNLVLWWMNNNRAYIEAYNADYGTTVSGSEGSQVYTFTQPSMEFLPLLPNGGTGDDDPDQEQNRNAVFQFFKDYAQNKGSWNSRGVRWFITGDNTGIPSENGSSCFPGFFAEVFKQTDVIATDSNRSPTEEEFNEFMVNALRNRQAIGFTAHDIAGTNTGAHAMVIWGAEFDAEGKIAYVYFCDNNNADQDVNGAVITRRGICYVTDPTSPSGWKRTYLQHLPPKNGSSVENKKYLISSLCAVDLRQDIWAKKYPSVNPAQ